MTEDEFDQARIDAEEAYVQGRCSRVERDEQLAHLDERENWR